MPEGHVFSGNPTEPIGLFLKAAPENFKRGVKEAEAETGRKVTCFMSDAFLWFVGNMAAEMDISWVPLWTAGPLALSAHVCTDELREKLGHNSQSEKVLEFIPGMSAIRSIDLPEGVVMGNLEAPFARMLHKMGQMMSLATAVAINSFEELDPIVTNDLKSKLKKLLNVGLFSLSLRPPSSHLDDPNRCLPWLNEQKPFSVAYVSFGTTSTPPPNELMALAEALEAIKTPFLWSVRDNFKDNLPLGFLERTSSYGKSVQSAPQMKVLTHSSIGVFITHCGWNSVTESIAGGVPMICRPFFGDQGLNSRIIESVWGIGVTVRDGAFTKRGTISALETILLGQEGEKMRERIRKLKDLANKAVDIDGSSTKNFESLVSVVTSVKNNSFH